MSKETMHNSEASLEVRALKDVLSEEELQKVFGGSVLNHSDFNFVHLRSPWGGGGGGTGSFGQAAIRGAISGASGAV
jgi:hypothetical protein